MSESRTMRLILVAIGTVDTVLVGLLALPDELKGFVLPVWVAAGAFLGHMALLYLSNQLPALGREKEGN